jgi:cytochrome c-type biogenesis protein CcmH/NrfG
VTATDQVGHRVSGEPQTVEGAKPAPASPPFGAAAPGSDADSASLPPSAKARAVRLYSEAIAHRDRGEYREGIARLREVIKLNPQTTDAFAEMASMLYRVDDYDRALNAYDIALKQQPNHRAALQGAAMVYLKKFDYASAAQRLRTVLRYNPADAEVWMNLGDVAIYQGDEMLARECYTRATQIDPAATQTIADARKRLSLLSEVSRTYRPSGK